MSDKVKNLEPVKSEFKQEIGVFGGVSIIGGIMVGSGIFYLGSYVLMRTGMSLGLALLCWVVGGIVSLLGGLCFAELGASRPVAGGMVVYLNEAYHPIVGFLFGFVSWLLSGAGSIAAIAVALPTALRTFFDLSDSVIKLIAIVLIVALTAYNYFGVKKASILQNVSMVAKLIPIGIIMFGALMFGKQTPDLSLLPQDGSVVSFGSIIGMIAFATVATLWAYEGWTNLNTVAEEMKNPKRNLPLSLVVAIGSILVLYTLFNYSIYRVLPHNEIVTMINDGNYYLGTEVAKRIFGNVGGTIVLVGMIISMFGSLNGMILAFPRTYYAMSKEGHFFKSFGKLHPTYKVPSSALIAQCIIAVILVLSRNLDQLTSMVVFTGMLFNVLVVGAVLIYRKKYPTLERPYKIFAYPATVIITILIFAGLMINTFIEDPVTALIGFVVPAIGCFVYYYFDKQLKKDSKGI
ncbi:APA family basic amino acid/polyamine antiporter [Sedimentibacter acidaminivorans]|uniref:APA family basic amino acid/polyamine antiporter n=1 Tax=Sedimentibacter acidaminivorans TaxID=913099 RepID=A0ABS4GH62_9FIRM|nr:amino acid permease [Sedimentibacter acidaminivorans]MBP1927020.1 APA family basic amino acid/polyamine antiporter [Sedimentibacter acidaminivorans]